MWIKTHWKGSAIAAISGAAVPVIDAFFDVWKILDKIRPIYGFPIWLVVLLCILIIAIGFILWFSNKQKCPPFWKKQSVKDWLKYALLGIGVLLLCALLSMITTSITQKKNKKMFRECMMIEQQYLKDGTHGLREFYEGNYKAAYDSLKLYYHSDPVSACYYAEIIYDGLWLGVEQHETTNAVRLLDSAASHQFYRAIFKMEDYYYRQKMEKEAMRYAEQFFLVSEKPIKSDDTILKEQTIRWLDLCFYSYNRLFWYLIDNNHDVSEIERINKVYWGLLPNLIGERKSLLMRDWCDVKGALYLGDKSAKRKAKRALRKYDYDPSFARLYATILLDGQLSDTCEVDMKKGAKAEAVLIEALRVASEKSLVDSQATENEDEIIRLALFLSELYDFYGYGIEAAEMDQLASGFELKKIYKSYEDQNK